jgi:hypothetical protein
MAAVLCDLAAPSPFEGGGEWTMAKAFVGGVEHVVRVDRDLGESWAVSIVAKGPARVLSDQLVRVVKLQGNDRASVLKGGLEILQKQGFIERFELEPGEEPVPPPPKPPPAAAKPAAAPAATPAAKPVAPAAGKPDAAPAAAPAANPAAPAAASPADKGNSVPKAPPPPAKTE